jgi:hypothetical protein
MTEIPPSKIYHIYAKDRCLFHSIKEEEFSATWNTLKNMVVLIKTYYEVEDLYYEELVLPKRNTESPSY